MKKILFLIHDLGQGGAEKVLVNLVNNMDRTKFDITVMAMFGGGINEQFLMPHIRLINVFKKEFRANSKIMKLFTPKQLHRRFIKESYDIEVSYLEGPSARVISGCTNGDTKLVSWIHVEQHTMKRLASAFRSKKEARRCYNRFDKTVCVSQYVKDDFCKILNFTRPCEVLYNTVESGEIIEKSSAEVSGLSDDGCIRLIGVGTLKASKGFDRMIRVAGRLRAAGIPVHLYILGRGELEGELEEQIRRSKLKAFVTLLGYHTNPYAFVSKCDVFVCSSHSEGFSTAATEALIVGTPVCTVEVSGMKEMLGCNNEYGIVTDNSEDALYQGLYNLLKAEGKLEYYKKQAWLRGRGFSTDKTVNAVSDMLLGL